MALREQKRRRPAGPARAEVAERQGVGDRRGARGESDLRATLEKPDEPCGRCDQYAAAFQGGDDGRGRRQVGVAQVGGTAEQVVVQVEQVASAQPARDVAPATGPRRAGARSRRSARHEERREVSHRSRVVGDEPLVVQGAERGVQACLPRRGSCVCRRTRGRVVWKGRARRLGRHRAPDRGDDPAMGSAAAVTTGGYASVNRSTARRAQRSDPPVPSLRGPLSRERRRHGCLGVGPRRARIPPLLESRYVEKSLCASVGVRSEPSAPPTWSATARPSRSTRLPAARARRQMSSSSENRKNRSSRPPTPARNLGPEHRRAVDVVDVHRSGENLALRREVVLRTRKGGPADDGQAKRHTPRDGGLSPRSRREVTSTPEERRHDRCTRLRRRGSGRDAGGLAARRERPGSGGGPALRRPLQAAVDGACEATFSSFSITTSAPRAQATSADPSVEALSTTITRPVWTPVARSSGSLPIQPLTCTSRMNASTREMMPSSTDRTAGRRTAQSMPPDHADATLPGLRRRGKVAHPAFIRRMAARRPFARFTPHRARCILVAVVLCLACTIGQGRDKGIVDNRLEYSNRVPSAPSLLRRRGRRHRRVLDARLRSLELPPTAGARRGLRGGQGWRWLRRRLRRRTRSRHRRAHDRA